jgi:hypothetical protein
LPQNIQTTSKIKKDALLADIIQQELCWKKKQIPRYIFCQTEKEIGVRDD